MGMWYSALRAEEVALSAPAFLERIETSMSTFEEFSILLAIALLIVEVIKIFKDKK